jgi:hypothetical protein
VGRSPHVGQRHRRNIIAIRPAQSKLRLRPTADHLGVVTVCMLGEQLMLLEGRSGQVSNI